MADIKPDTLIKASFDTNAGRGLVWTTYQVAYAFYLDSTNGLVYNKTTDGGLTWGGAVVVALASNNTLSCDIWFDKWTPGGTGDLIHCVWKSGTNDAFWYRHLDTSDDTFGAAEKSIHTAVGIGCTDGNRNLVPTITKSVGGSLFAYYAERSGATGILAKSTDAGVNWDTTLATPQEGTVQDQMILFPANLADTDDIWCVFWDVGSNEIDLKTYDDSGDSWALNNIVTTMAESATQMQMNGTIRHSDGHLLFAAWSQLDNALADLRFWDITDGGTITEKTNVLTDNPEAAICSVLIDQTTERIFVFYVDGTSWGGLAHVKYNSSLDGGTTWGVQRQMSQTQDDLRWICAGLSVKSDTYGKIMPIWHNDDLADIVTNFVNAVDLQDILTNWEESLDFSTAEKNALWGPYWIDENTATYFYFDSGGEIQSAKTTDGGASWLTIEVEATAGNNATTFACWFDRENAGDETGTLVHIAKIMNASGGDNIRYFTYDIDSNTRGTYRIITNITASGGAGVDKIGITKTVSGNLVALWYTPGDELAYKSDDAGVTWDAIAYTLFATPEESDQDWLIMFPVTTDDDNDAGVLYWDHSGNQMSLGVYNDSANAWSGTAISPFHTENLTRRNFDAAVRKSDQHIIFAGWSAFDSSFADLRVVDINPSTVTGVAHTDMTDVLTDSAESFQVSVFIDQQTDDIYVSYFRGGTIGSLVDAYYKKSTDGGTTWGSEQSLNADINDDHNIFGGGRSVGTSGGRFYPIWLNDDTGKAFGSRSNIAIPAVAAGGTRSMRQLIGVGQGTRA